MKLFSRSLKRFSSTFKYLSFASMLTAASSARGQHIENRTAARATGESLSSFLGRVNAASDSAGKDRIIRAYLEKLKSHGHPVIENTNVHFLFYGNARDVAVAGDFNGWKPEDSLSRIDRTNLFWLRKTFERAARFEYKFVVDSSWILDPLNTRQAMGGFGPNSEIWMPDYRPPSEIIFRESIDHGRLDTLRVRSNYLKVSHPVIVYTPPGYRNSRNSYPSLYVTDGGEFITLGLMTNVLDNMVADGRMEPIVVVFVDPRTNVRDSESSQRMTEYTLNDDYVRFLAIEVRPKIQKRYRILPVPESTAIMGASLGGLISTYAAITRPDIFGLVAAQSPSFWWNKGAIMKLISTSPKKNVRFYLDTGTMRDAQNDCRKMINILDKKGYTYLYTEYPEGHNWVNWRSHVDEILLFFWGKK